MRATWQAVATLKLLGREVPRPANPVEPVNEVQVHVPLHKSPLIDHQDPVNEWAYRRIALPIYEHFLADSGSRIVAIGWLSRWARAVVGPENASYLTEGRGLLHGGWGQCGQMSQLLQQLALSVDHAARYSFIIGDVNCEILVQEEGWEAPHWCLFIPFTNEYPELGRPTPRATLDGWSVLDLIVSHNSRSRNLNYPSLTRIGDRLFNSVRVETVDYQAGRWGREVTMDSTTTYTSPQVAELYPAGSW